MSAVPISEKSRPPKDFPGGPTRSPIQFSPKSRPPKDFQGGPTKSPINFPRKAYLVCSSSNSAVATFHFYDGFKSRLRRRIGSGSGGSIVAMLKWTLRLNLKLDLEYCRIDVNVSNRGVGLPGSEHLR